MAIGDWLDEHRGLIGRVLTLYIAPLWLVLMVCTARKALITSANGQNASGWWQVVVEMIGLPAILYALLYELPRAILSKTEIDLLPGESPSVHAYIETMPDRMRPIAAPPFQVSGHLRLGAQQPRRPSIVVPVYMRARSSRAGRNIQLVVRFSADPMPGWFAFTREVSGAPISLVKGQATDPLSVDYPEDLVVYEDPICVGQLAVYWHSDIENTDLPKEIVLEYTIHTLDGTSRGNLELSVKWPDA